MAIWTISKKLNVSPYAAPLVIQIKQYTSDFALKLQLYSTVGDLDIPAGATTKIRGTKRDGNGYELTGTRIGHTCTFSGTKEQMQQMTAAHGRCVFEVVVEHDGKELITANFYLEVQRAAMDAGTVTSESIIEEFADFQSKITAAQAAATAAQAQADRAEAAAASIDFGLDSIPTQGSNNAVSSGGVYSALAGKADAVSGKGLSANDYSDAEKQKVTDATADLSAITTATAEDVGKALKAKTVTNGKVVEWEFGEAGGDAELAERVDNIAEATVNETSQRTDFTFSSYEESRAINASGDIVSTSFATDVVYVFAVAEGAETIGFYAIGRISGNATYAFYSADTYESCSSASLIGTRQSYVGATDNTATVPAGAKILIICSKVNPTNTYYTSSGYISKADANFASAYNADKVYFVGDYCTYNGNTYIRTAYTGAAGVFSDTEWEQITVLDRVQSIEQLNNVSQFFDPSLFQRGTVNSLGEVVSRSYVIVLTNIYHITETTVIEIADGYKCWIYYYNADGTKAGNNGGLTTLQARTILKDSYVRIDIQKTGDTSAIPDNMIPVFASKVTFATAKVKQDADIQTGVEGAMDALVAKMYQKGSAPTTFEKRPCIIVAGQSNIDGRVPVADLPSDITMPLNNIMIANNNGAFSAYNATSVWDITTAMFAELNKIGDTFYDIKTSQGGTSISEYGDSAYHWTPFYENIRGGLSNSLLLTFESKIRKTISVNPDVFDIRAFVWQQGEGDRSATSKQASLNYYKNFKCLVAYVRGIVGNEKLPVICGTVSHLSGQYDPIVEEATLRVAEEDPYMTCIDMSGATLLDSYHFDATSAVYFGRMAYDALIDFGVITGTKIAPVCPWQN